MKVVGLFSGIGGIERGFESAGFECVGLCEKDESALSVLEERFPGVGLSRDVATLRKLPKCDVVTAGFPCQDLSQAGGKSGIGGSQSNLVSHLFRLLGAGGRRSPEFVFIENVSYMLKLDKGAAMKFLVQELEKLGYRWAYRTVDARSFGVPQRRHRVLLLASKSIDPKNVLFSDDFGKCPTDDNLKKVMTGSSYGFYWTEGSRGIGWARDSVPPIKGGSSVGIPSPPAVWRANSGFLGTIDLRDAERLQGFPEDWTRPADELTHTRKSFRWRLVGNAVCVPKIRWAAECIRSPRESRVKSVLLGPNFKWPWSAFGGNGEVYEARASLWPVPEAFLPLDNFLRHPLKPLSERATLGYLKRLKSGSCWTWVPENFVNGIHAHLKSVSGSA